MTATARCPKCRNTGHVCENHPGRPWGGLCCGAGATGSGVCEHGACGCGAGMPCPACCPPIPEDGSASITAAFTPDFKRAPCCDLHGRNCEPPSELCCRRCTEADHPRHRSHGPCSAPDLSRAGAE